MRNRYFEVGQRSTLRSQHRAIRRHGLELRVRNELVRPLPDLEVVAPRCGHRVVEVDRLLLVAQLAARNSRAGLQSLLKFQ